MGGIIAKEFVMEDGYYQNTRPEIYGMVPKAVKRVLEIGCAAGGFRLNFPKNIEYWGVEPVREAAEEACLKDIKVFYGTYDAVASQIPNKYFDVIVCNDVIEHITDTGQFLLSLKSKLTTNGVILGSIPNVRFWGNLVNLLVRRDWKYEKSGVLDKTHTRFFTCKSFRRVLQVAGFEIVSLKGIESFRMKILKVLFSPFLVFLGFDICSMQFMFKAVSKE